MDSCIFSWERYGSFVHVTTIQSILKFLLGSFLVAGGVMGTDLSQPVTRTLTESKHCSLYGLFDYFNELEEIIWNPVMLPQQHSSL